MRLFTSFIITMMIMSIIIGGGYLIFSNYDLKSEMAQKESELEELREKVKYLETRNKQLVFLNNHKNRNSYQRQNGVTRSSPKTLNRTVPKSKNTYQSETVSHNQYSTKKEKYIPQKARKEQKTSNKKYQKFSRNIKLVSDSRISVLDDNRLKSNQMIYGRYYPKTQNGQIYNINCDQKERMLGVRNDCSMKLSFGMDKVYLSKMNARSIKEVDYTDHMIECKYNQKYGIMHDCQAKLAS